jgi:hypothetical protein
VNILGLVFSLLLILSYGFYACWDKQTASHSLRTTYVGHEKVHRKILNSYQSEVYKNAGRHGGASISSSTKEVLAEEQEVFTEEEQKDPHFKKPDLNRHCAKLNLWLLAQEGRANHPLLYEVAANMIRAFYKQLVPKEKQFEYHFLDALLTAIKTHPQNIPFSFEKVHLPDYQLLYYKMLKGTKDWDIAAGIGYPSLLDYVKFATVPEKICLFHAHPDVLHFLFGPQVAATLHSAIHTQGGPPPTQELVTRLCNEAHLMPPDPDLLALFEYGHPHHQEYQKTFIAHDQHVSLRKTVPLASKENQG